MKKKLLVWMLTAAMVIEAGGTLTYAKEPGTEPELETELVLGEPESLTENEKTAKEGEELQQPTIPDETEELEQPEESGETEELEQPEELGETEELEQPEESGETEELEQPKELEEPEQPKELDEITQKEKPEEPKELKEPMESKQPEELEEQPAKKEISLPPTEEIKPERTGEYFIEYVDDVEKYAIGENINDGYVWDESKYYLFEMTEEKNIWFDIRMQKDMMFEDELWETGDAKIKIHKVKIENDWDDIYSMECVSCVVQQTGSSDSSGCLSFSGTKKLMPSWYLIEIASVDEWFEYSLETKDMTEYATSLSIPSTQYMKIGNNKILPVSNILPLGAVKGITWSSDKTSVAKVDKNGKITPVSYGTCNIKAKLKNGKTYNCKVYVENPQLNSTKLGILKGKSKKLQVKNVYQKVSWSSSHSNIATVSASGKITAKKVGKVTITATIEGKKLNCKVTIEDPKLNIKSKQLTVGDTCQLTIKGSIQKVSWKSGNKTRASVSRSGLVTAKKPGAVKIYGTVDGKKFTSTINIKETKLKTLSVKMAVGTARTLEWKSRVRNVKWSSENKKIATVNSKGIITAKRTGKTKIVAKVGTQRYVCTVTCENPKLNKTSVSIDQNVPITLKVNGTTMKVTWKTSDASIAAVSSKGKVTGKKRGKVTITARVGGKNLNCKVTVKGLKPSFTVRMSKESDYYANLALMQIKNTGKGNLRIYSANAKFIDEYFNFLDRNMKMADYQQALANNIVYVNYIDIAPGQQADVLFVLEGDASIYDTKTTYKYDFSYDGIMYQGKSSIYYGSYYSKK